jgi:UDP-N-acetylglucosamine:(glucosyl)LPS alpha-1,2-N-acetylglucosaminyltransferase
MLRKVALVSPGFLPVPAVDGGAIEVLMTDFIDGNEVNPHFEIDVYTIASEKLKAVSYKYSKLIEVKPLQPLLFYRIVYKVWNLLLKLFRINRFGYVNEYFIYKAIKSRKYDFVIIENNMNLYKWIYQKTANKNNLVFHLHNDIGAASKSYELCRLIGQTAKHIIVVSDYIRRRLADAISLRNIDILYNCVDIERFHPDLTDNSAVLRRRYNLAPEEIVFMFSGRAVPEKGVYELVTAFSRICEHYPIKLLIVGSSWFHLIEADDYLKMVMTTANSMKEKIIFTGYIYPEDMPNMYAMADVVVIPSIWEEPFGVVALEAMAMKKPMIISKSGGLVEVVSESSALFVDKGHDFVDQLADSMKRLIEDRNLRQSLANSAYSELMSREEFHKQNYFDHFIKLISGGV